jgi:hypothetical protein
VDFIVKRPGGALHECLGEFNLCLLLHQIKSLASFTFHGAVGSIATVSDVRGQSCLIEHVMAGMRFDPTSGELLCVDGQSRALAWASISAKVPSYAIRAIGGKIAGKGAVK